MYLTFSSLSGRFLNSQHPFASLSINLRVLKDRVYVMIIYRPQPIFSLKFNWTLLFQLSLQELVWKAEIMLSWCQKAGMHLPFFQPNKLAPPVYNVKGCTNTLEHWTTWHQIFPDIKVSIILSTKTLIIIGKLLLTVNSFTCLPTCFVERMSNIKFIYQEFNNKSS